MATMELTDPNYWSVNFGEQKLAKFRRNSYHKYLKRFLISDPTKTCIEIGAYPGGNLGYMAKEYQYIPTAIDFVAETAYIESLMQYNGIDNCTVFKEDFLKWQHTSTYDVVVSHGFVEHFTDYENVIEKHIDILSSSGMLVLTVPYLEFYQLWIRKYLYTPEKYKKVLEVHNREIMQLGKLKHIIRDNFGLKLLFAKYIKGMSIWFPANSQTIQMNKIGAYKIAKRLGEITERYEISNKFISPEILIIAKKE